MLLIGIVIYVIIGLILSFVVKNIEIEWENQVFLKVTQNKFLFYFVCITLWLPALIVLLISNPTIEKLDDK